MTIAPSREQFDAHATKYAVSPVHQHGPSLPVLLAFAAPSHDDVALDVATGTGHTAHALAPHVKQVIGIDVSPNMLAQAQKLAEEYALTNLRFEEATAEQLPFPAGQFTLVTARHAPHHFHDVRTFLQEVARVLAPGGRFVLADQITPEATMVDWVDTWQRLRDPSHYRQRTVQEWRDLAQAAGLTWERDQIVPYTLDFAWWVEQAGCTAAGRAALERHARAADAPTRAALGLTFDHTGHVIAHVEPMLVVRLTRPDMAAGA